MYFIRQFFNKILYVLQLILILLFIIFEEIIWEGIAQPIYNYFHSLNLVQRLEGHLVKVNAYVALFIFVMLLIVVEAAGIISGVLLVDGQVLAGGFLYIAKIPLAAFTFWIFKVTKFKMLSFNFMAWAYKRITAFMKWLKSLQTYQELIDTLKKTKEWLKKKFKAFKERFFSKKSGFMERFKHLYQVIKNSLKRSQPKSDHETNPTQTKE